MNEFMKARREREKERARRKPILEEIHLLLKLDASGWNVDRQLEEAGHLLGSDERPGYMPKDLGLEEYEKYLLMAKHNDIPARVFKDRLRRKKPPLEAATVPYYKKSEMQKQKKPRA